MNKRVWNVFRSWSDVGERKSTILPHERYNNPNPISCHSGDSNNILIYLRSVAFLVPELHVAGGLYKEKQSGCLTLKHGSWLSPTKVIDWMLVGLQQNMSLIENSRARDTSILKSIKIQINRWKIIKKLKYRVTLLFWSTSRDPLLTVFIGIPSQPNLFERNFS